MAIAPDSAPPPPETVLPQTAEAVRDQEVHAAATETATHEGAEGAHEAGGGGLPQFEFEYWGGQIVWLLLIFAVLYILFAKVFLPRLRRVQDERAGTIAGAIDQARQVQAEAEAQAQAAQAEIADARAQAKRTAAAAKARVAEEVARRQAEQEAVVAARIAEAEGRIGATRDAAMAKVGEIAVDTTQAIVGKLTGQPASAAEAAGAVKGAA